MVTRWKRPSPRRAFVHAGCHFRGLPNCKPPTSALLALGVVTRTMRCSWSRYRKPPITRKSFKEASPRWQEAQSSRTCGSWSTCSHWTTGYDHAKSTASDGMFIQSRSSSESVMGCVGEHCAVTCMSLLRMPWRSRTSTFMVQWKPPSTDLGKMKSLGCRGTSTTLNGPRRWGKLSRSTRMWIAHLGGSCSSLIPMAARMVQPGVISLPAW
mmetsp:Transcript_37124/g.106966  ORF Transcript_37124/g.106966 Transcript_37124/m.106966 type:complete len:211 (-) Transcript_37124:782-1414(-)